MKKKDLVRSAKKGWPNPEKMVNSIFRDINKAIINKETIIIYNFGKFEIVQSNVKEVHNFQENRRVMMPKTYKVKFTSSPKIIKLLNERNRVNNDIIK